MKANTNPVKGMRDIIPQEKEVRDYVESVIVRIYKQSGFELNTCCGKHRKFSRQQGRRKFKTHF